MSLVLQSAKCDACGKNRVEDSNHWLTMLEWYGDRDDFYAIHGIAEPIKLDHKHACGLECATKLFSRWFAEGHL